MTGYGQGRSWPKLTPDQARMVEDNLGLVGMVVRRWYPRATAGWHDDAIQDGTIGLVRAVQLYNPDVGRFSTYAVRWIRQAVQRGIGEREGRSYRAARNRGADFERPASIDAPNDDGLALAPLLSTPPPPDPVDDLVAALGSVCTDDLDVQIAAGMLAAAERGERYSAAAASTDLPACKGLVTRRAARIRLALAPLAADLGYPIEAAS